MLIPDGWTTTTVGELGRWRGGGTPSKQNPSYWTDGSIPWVSPKDMKGWELSETEEYITPRAVEESATSPLAAGSVLVVTRSGILRHTFPVALARVPVVINQDLKALEPCTLATSEFVANVLRFHEKQILQRCSKVGTTVESIDSRALLEFPLTLPPLSEQRKIAAILSSVDATLEKTEAVIEQLQAVKKAMMQELLTRGLPGRHTRFKKTAIGTVSEDWNVAPLRTVASIQTGIAKSKKRDGGSIEVPYLRVANVQDGYLDLTEMKTIRVEPEALTRYGLRRGDVLFTEGGDADKLGRGCVWNGEIEPCLHQNHVFAARPRPSALVPQFLAYFGASPAGKQYFLECSKQTTNLASINSSQLGALPVPLPPIDEQEAIVTTIGSFDRQLSAEKTYSAELRSVKSALMSVLLTGQLRVTPDEETTP